MSAHTGHTVIIVNGWIWCEDCGHALGAVRTREVKG